MLRRLLGVAPDRVRTRRRRTARPTIAFPDVAPDRPVYAIGDVHGRGDLLAGLVERILEEAPGWSVPPDLVVLGDFVDRGEHTLETLELLAELARMEAFRPVYLMGNHESMLLAFLADAREGLRWMRVGGMQTLLSLGIGAYETESEAELDRIRAELAQALAPYMPMLEGLALSHRNGNLLFSHAGADPARSPARQSRRALLWGHPDFERTPRDDGIWVVHGHRPVDEPRAERGRIALDTGAYYSGCLSAAAIAPGEVRFLRQGVAGPA